MEIQPHIILIILGLQRGDLFSEEETGYSWCVTIYRVHNNFQCSRTNLLNLEW